MFRHLAKHTRVTATCLILTLLLAGCGGGSSSVNSKNNVSAIISGDNVAPLTVDAGPSGLSTGQYTVNEVFTDVTICDAESGGHCQTIHHILVDTGSSGLRVMASVLDSSLNLPIRKTASNQDIGECGMFADGYTWGPVKTATVKLANQAALSIPIQVIADPNFYGNNVPSTCSNSGATSENTVSSFGANGVIGVGYFLQDCGSYCQGYASNNIYYQCTSSGCLSSKVQLYNQLANPVSQFASGYNNGVMLSLPRLDPGGDAIATGSMVLGINTYSNNQLNTAKIFNVDPSTGYLVTSYAGQTLSHSFIDSGSNGLYFNSTLTSCPSPASGFYCPPATQNLSATISDLSGTSASISFDVANATKLFSTGYTAFDDLAGTGFSNAFDWGLPFFYGRKVFVVFEGENVGGSTGPFIAF